MLVFRLFFSVCSLILPLFSWTQRDRSTLSEVFSGNWIIFYQWFLRFHLQQCSILIKIQSSTEQWWSPWANECSVYWNIRDPRYRLKQSSALGRWSDCHCSRLWNITLVKLKDRKGTVHNLSSIRFILAFEQHMRFWANPGTNFSAPEGSGRVHFDYREICM